MVGTAAILAYRFATPAEALDYVYNGIGIFGAISVIAGIRIWRPAAAWIWWLLAAGIGCWVMGDAVFVLLTARASGDLPFPTVADAWYYAFYPLVAVSLVGTLRRRLPGRDLAGLVDAALVSVAASVLSWTYLMAPYARDHSLGLLEKLASIGYPLGDLLLIALLARLLLSPGRRPATFSLLVAALTCNLISDSVYGYQSLAGTYNSGDLVDIGWLAAYVLLGTAALHPSMHQLTRHHRLDAPNSARRLVVMAGAALTAPVLIMTRVAQGDVADIYVLGGGCVLMFTLVLIRMSRLLDEIESQRDRLRLTSEELHQAQADRRLLLDRTVRVAEQERLRLAANLHDGPVQRLAALALVLDRALLRLDRNDTAAAVDLLERGHDELSGEVEGLRRVMSDLRPPILDEAGFVAGVQDLLADFARRHGVTATLTGALELPLAVESEAVLYRVTQEALTNIGRHAAATTVGIGVQDLQDGVALTVSDDGVGFTLAPARALLSEGHFGLVGMRERLEAAGGVLTVDTAPATGTRLTAWLPRPRPSHPRDSEAADGELPVDRAATDGPLDRAGGAEPSDPLDHRTQTSSLRRPGLGRRRR